MLYRMTKTLERHRYGLLNFFHAIFTAPLQDANNKIKTMIRQDYGVPDHKFFTLKIKSASPFQVFTYGMNHIYFTFTNTTYTSTSNSIFPKK